MVIVYSKLSPYLGRLAIFDFQLPGLSIFNIFTLFESEFHGYQMKFIVEYIFFRKYNEEIPFFAIGNSCLLKEFV